MNAIRTLCAYIGPGLLAIGYAVEFVVTILRRD